MPAVPALRRAMPRSRPSAARIACELVVRAPEHEQLGRALNEVDDVGRERTACGGLPRLLAPRQAAGEPGHRRRREHEGHEQHEPGLGQEPPQRAPPWRRRRARRRRRAGSPAAPRPAASRRRRRRAPRGRRGGRRAGPPAPAPRAACSTRTRRSASMRKRGVVADQPLAVAQEAAGEPEELDADDGEGERGLRRVAVRHARSARPTCP